MNKYILLQEILRKMHEQQDKYPLIHDASTPFSLVEEMIDSVSLTSTDTIFTHNIEFAIALIHKYNVEPKRITIFADVCPTTETFAAKLGINYIDAWNYNMKFDVVFGNPPYGRTLHMEFFNKAVDSLVADGGTVCFIQPCTAYDNKKPNQLKQALEMRKHVEQNTTEIYMVDGGVFKNAAIATQLSITKLVKDGSNTGLVEFIEYIDGSTYADVCVDNINSVSMDPVIYSSAFKKIFDKSRSGSLLDLVKDDGSSTFKLQQVRGHAGTDDFYTIISKDVAHQIMHDGYGLAIDPANIDNVVAYLKTNLARFALSLYKFNGNNHRGELGIIPSVDFTKTWTDEKLMAEWGITEEEYAEILKVIPAYYD